MSNVGGFLEVIRVLQTVGAQIRVLHILFIGALL